MTLTPKLRSELSRLRGALVPTLLLDLHRYEELAAKVVDLDFIEQLLGHASPWGGIEVTMEILERVAAAPTARAQLTEAIARAVGRSQDILRLHPSQTRDQIHARLTPELRVQLRRSGPGFELSTDSMSGEVNALVMSTTLAEGGPCCVGLHAGSGQLLLGFVDGSVVIWEVRTNRPTLGLHGHRDRIRVAAWRPDGAAALTASRDGELRYWDTQSGECLAVLPGQEGGVTSFAVDDAWSTVVVGADDGHVRVWHLSTARLVLERRPHAGSVTSCDLRGDRVLTASHDGTIHVWRLGDPDRTQVLDPGLGAFMVARWVGEEGVFATVSTMFLIDERIDEPAWDEDPNSRVSVHVFDSGQNDDLDLRPEPGAEDQYDPIRELARVLMQRVPQDRWGERQRVRLWRVGGESIIAEREIDFDNDVISLWPASDPGRAIAMIEREGLHELELESGRAAPVLIGLPTTAGADIASNERSLAAYSRDLVQVWKLGSPDTLRHVAPIRPIVAMTFDPSTSELVGLSQNSVLTAKTAADETAVTWNVAAELSPLLRTPFVTFSRPSASARMTLAQRVSMPEDARKVIAIRFAAEPELVGVMPHDADVVQTALSPDGRAALTITEREVHVWDLEAKAKVRRFPAPSATPEACAIAQRGVRSVSAHGESLWSWPRRGEVVELKAHTRLVCGCVIADDGGHAASIDRDGIVLLWNLGTGDVIRNWQLRALEEPSFGPLLLDEQLRFVIASEGEHTLHLLSSGSPEPLAAFTFDAPIRAMTLKMKTREPTLWVADLWGRTHRFTLRM